jgi:hypothetical protein
MKKVLHVATALVVLGLLGGCTKCGQDRPAEPPPPVVDPNQPPTDPNNQPVPEAAPADPKTDTESTTH